ncbi:secreted RxLR effector protein 161-like [Malus domestica]|uniref:secreted RxLR effector protein 161-like n=1 Tax=Malus domestica TaxID=3750 RepID=UPI0039767880
MEQSKKCLLPVRHGIHLSKSMGPKSPKEIRQMSVIPYASAIGSLMYAMICTRPDIAYAVNITSRYQSNPGSEHWAAVKTVLKYLRRTKDMFLVYGRVTELRVEAYTDADFQSDVDDRSSNSRYVFTLNGEDVSWKSKKQDVIVDFTKEAEYVTAAEAGK